MERGITAPGLRPRVQELRPGVYGFRVRVKG